MVAVALGVNLVLNLIFLILLGKGLVFSAIILAISWIVMAVGAMWVIWKAYPFSLDWRFLGKNVVIICVLCGMMWWVKGIILEFELSRWLIFGRLFIFFIGYGIVLV